MHIFERERIDNAVHSIYVVSIFSVFFRCPLPALMSNSSIFHNTRRFYVRDLANVRHCRALLEQAGNMGGAWKNASTAHGYIPTRSCV